MFELPDFESVRAAVLRDTQSFYPDADISPDSDHFVHASRLAACAVGQYAHQAWIVRQIFPDTADTAYLERHAALRGLRRRQAAFADGEAVLAAEAGAVLPSGLQIKAGNRYYRTVAAATAATAGTLRVAVAAEAAGSLHNTAATAAVLMAPPAGVAADCTVQAQGGTDAETDASLLARLLEAIRRPAAGGNRYDYKNWALSIDGVAAAYVYPLRRGLGTVDIAVTAENGSPAREVVAKVQAYIDEMRPVTAKNVKVSAPDETAVAVRVAVKTDGISIEQARERIRAALADYFARLAVGEDVVVSQLETAVSNIAGIADRRLTAPAGNLKADLTAKLEWFRLGSVEVEAMG